MPSKTTYPRDQSFETEGQAKETPCPSDRFCVIAARAARRDKADRLLAEIDALMQAARHAPGFLRIDILQPFGEPDIFLHNELWQSKAAHDAFDAGPMHETFAQNTAELVAHHNIPLHYRVIRTYGPSVSASPAEVVQARRLPRVDPELAGHLADADGVPLPGHLEIFDVLANATALFAPLMRCAGTILGEDMALSPRLRELVILQVGQLSGCAYEMTQHAPLAREAGLTDMQVAALRRGDDETAFDAEDRTILRFVREALSEIEISDATWDAAASFMEPRALTELLIVAGFYRMLCMVMRSARLPVETSDDRPWPKAAADTR
jgi:AhpD family alkylhydroperoxidase